MVYLYNEILWILTNIYVNMEQSPNILSEIRILHTSCCHLSFVFKQEGERCIQYVYIAIKSLSKESQENGKKWFPLDQGTRGSVKEGDFFFFLMLYYIYLFIFCLFIYLVIYLFMPALGLCCCERAFSSWGERALLFVAVCGLLIVVVSLVAEHRL